jgi:hypothetical protein
MKINEVIVESEQLDELSAMDIARGVGSAVGKTAHAAGAVAGGLKGAWDAGKSGYQQGLSFTGGQRVGRSSSGRAASQAPAASGGNLDSMADQDLEAMKSKIDSVLAARKGQPAAQGQAAPAAPTKPVKGQMATVNGKDYMFAGSSWVDEKNAVAKGDDLKQIKDMFAQGKIGPAPKERPGTAPAAAGKSPQRSPIPSAPEILKALSKLKPEQVEAVRDMLTAKIEGQRNVAEGVGSAIKGAWNKLTGQGGLSFDAIKQAIDQMTPDVAKSILDQFPASPAAKPSGQGLPGLSAPTLTPKPTGNVTASMGSSTPGSITTGGVSRPGAPAAKPAAAPTATPKAEPAPAASPAAAPASPYGQLTPDEQKFVADREKEGVEPETIKQALAARKNRKPVGAPTGGPEKTQAKRTTDYNWYDKGGVNPSGTLRDADPASFAAAQAKKQPANEGFYSKFLGKQI